jgi:biotin carboxylase
MQPFVINPGKTYKQAMLYIVGTVSAEFRSYCAAHHLAYRRFTPVEANADGQTSFFVDMTSREAVLASLRTLPPNLDVTALMVCGYEHFVLPGAWLAEHFGVPFTSAASAARATDKIAMREAFAAADASITPAFQAVQHWQDIETFVAAHGLPVMLKPANLMKSLFISRNDSLDELRHNYETMTAALPDIYARYRLGEPRILVESCMTGSMHTVAGFVDVDGTVTLAEEVVDCRTARDIGVADSYLFSRTLPSALSAQDQTTLLQVATTGVQALGLSSTPVHVELMLTETGPKIIEIGARLGGYRPLMYREATGQDLYAAAVALTAGQSPLLQTSKHEAYSVLELFPETDGVLRAVHGLETGRKLPHVAHLVLKTELDQPAGRASSGYRAAVIAQLQGPDRASLDATASELRQLVTFDIQAD